MKKYRHIVLYLLPVVLLGYLTPAYAAELISIKDVVLTELKDGDSFKVQAAGRELHLRLYYVDCLETSASGFLKDRVLQQQDYFALKHLSSVLELGKQATEFTRRALAKPFTIHTSYAKAPGSASIRYYAFVETHDGKDLAHLLIAQGLARIYGKTRTAPDGTSSATQLTALMALRAVAKRTQTGVWRDSGVVDLPPYNMNTASSEQLQKIPGIGAVLADRIIAGRPYSSVQELRNVRGIGPKKLEIIAVYATMGEE